MFVVNYFTERPIFSWAFLSLFGRRLRFVKASKTGHWFNALLLFWEYYLDRPFGSFLLQYTVKGANNF
uniref:Uncharacterized protein n=1 Tax=Alcanivorax borkumensis (strain ATCC 700651 / DSM 11573 / NCIMB 13689 / SK2) TaxID=393595 RepID=Q0VNF4_ALCBS|nr:hypothetical protein ABO_1846 [Alcanivorax borkumensis SK2]